MGTSHRHKPTIKGDVNWGKTSRLIMGVAKNKKELGNLDSNPPANFSDQQIEKKKKDYSNAINRNRCNCIRNLVSAAGGIDKVSSGSSHALGHAGVFIVCKCTRMFSKIARNGINSWLDSHGYGNIAGNSRAKILQCVRKYLFVDVVGMDDTAANEAMDYILTLFEEDINEDASNFDSVVINMMNTMKIKHFIAKYFGMYIYYHLSQDFAEKLEHEKESLLADSTLKDIKNGILDDISDNVVYLDDVIDWEGNDGASFICESFKNIIKLLSDDED